MDPEVVNELSPSFVALVITGAVRTAFNLPGKWTPLLAIALGAGFAALLGTVDGVTLPEVIRGAIGGAAAVGLHKTFSELARK